MTAGESRRVIAHRLNFLFDVVVRHAGGNGVSETGWLPYTNTELGNALISTLEGPQDEPDSKVERLRAGEEATPNEIQAIARFFGVDVRFFGEDDDAVNAIYENLLDHALNECGVRHYRICRESHTSSFREQLRNVLPILRSYQPPPIKSNNTQPRRGIRSWRVSMTGPLSEEQIKCLCRNLVVELGMSPPLDPVELCSRLGELRGRRIKLKAADLGSTTSVGHVAPQKRWDRILYDKSAPKGQQALVIFHEVIHLIREHLDGEPLTCGISDSIATRENVYSGWKEWEAEIGARTLTKISRERALPNSLPANSGSAEQGIAAAFGFIRRGEQ